MYINMILAQILALYWYANELREQNLAVATAAYETEWFTFDVPLRKNILFMMMRAQRPASVSPAYINPCTITITIVKGLVTDFSYIYRYYIYSSTYPLVKLISLKFNFQILLGNIRPITLELFQNLLNTTYTFFTVLKRVYG